MVKRSFLSHIPQKNPILLWEEIARSHDWTYERLSTSEMIFVVEEFPCTLELATRWHEASGYLESIGLFDVTISEKNKLAVMEVLSALTHEMRLGSFYLCPSEQKPIFRHALLSYPQGRITLSHLTELTEEILFNGERLFQALQFLLKEGHSASEAIFAAFVEIGGEA